MGPQRCFVVEGSGAANCPGDIRKLSQPGRLPSLAFSPWFPATFFPFGI